MLRSCDRRAGSQVSVKATLVQQVCHSEPVFQALASRTAARRAAARVAIASALASLPYKVPLLHTGTTGNFCSTNIAHPFKLVQINDMRLSGCPWSTNRKLHRDKCPTRLTFDESFAQVAQFYSGKAVGDAQPQRGKRLHAEMTRQPRHRNRPNPKAYYHQDQHAQRHDIVRHLPADSLGGAAVKSHVCLPYKLS